MAFTGRLGGLIRQSISQSNAPNAQVGALGSMFNAIRSMSGSKLFVGGLSWGTDDQSLKDAFSAFGDVHEARVIIDRDTGRSKGFGFVNYDTDECASSALAAMDGKELDGRSIRVSYANERPSTPRFGGGGYGGGGGGYGGGGGSYGGGGGGYGGGGRGGRDDDF